jgi:3-hydroxybutyryl-CoA dehydrogenase
VVKELEEFSEANLVIEAVREDVQLKEEIFYRLDKILPPSGLIASNTSSISITRLGRATERPDRVIGMHFMNPVPVMALVEVIPGIATSPETISTIEAIAEQMKKVVVRGIDTPGFIVNRILVPMVNEAIFLLQEGVHKEAIDTAMKLGTNHPMGPLTLADFVGLDTLLAILRVLHKELGEDKYRPCPLLVKYVEAGWLGKKVGRGFYIYK